LQSQSTIYRIKDAGLTCRYSLMKAYICTPEALADEAAAEVGAEEVDCGLLGMARSAGNCSTELAVAALQRQDLLDGVDLYRLLAYLDNELIPAMAAYHYRPAVVPEDLVLGLSGCHSSFLKLFHQVAQEENVSLYQLIVKVSEIDRKATAEALLRQVAATLK